MSKPPESLLLRMDRAKAWVVLADELPARDLRILGSSCRLARAILLHTQAVLLGLRAARFLEAWREFQGVS